MSDFGIVLLSAGSILIPLIAAMFRYRHLSDRFQPLWYLLLTGSVNELVSYFSSYWKHSNQVNANCYTLLEFMLLLWQFDRFGVQKKSITRLALIAGVILWVTDNVWLHTLQQSNTLFRIVGSLIIFSFSIDTITRILLEGSGNPFQKAELALCLSFFAYHIYRSFILLFRNFAIHPYSLFSRRLWLTMAMINILIHITYTITILWIPDLTKTSSKYS